MALEHMGPGGVGRGNGVAFIVSAGVVYEIIAANCSSPQTTELNAGARAPTLMKWVNIGVGQAAFFVVVGAAIEPANAKAIVAGGAAAMGFMYALYLYARRCGLLAGETPTEQWANLWSRNRGSSS